MARTPELPSAEAVMNRLGEISQTTVDFKLKGARNTRTGLESYAKGVTPWQGFDNELFSRKITVQGLFDVPSTTAIIDRISTPVAKIGEKYGITIITPNKRDQNQKGHDLQPHFTMQFPHFGKDTDPNIIRVMRDKLSRPDSELQQAAKKLQGEIIPFDKLVLAGSMFYICVGDPTRSERTFASFWDIDEARTTINTIFKNVTPPLENPIYNDIIHSGIGRIVKINKSANWDGFADEVYATVGQQLQSYPIEAKIGSTYVGDPVIQALSVNANLINQR